MSKAAVIIPNWNGRSWLEDCLAALERQTARDFETILVDNGSEDGSTAFVQERFPAVRVISLSENTGFCHAVNEGIRQSTAPYVILLNNDTVAGRRFVEELVAGIERHPDALACQAKMLQMSDPDRIDDAGDLYCALGWAFARGRDRDRRLYNREEPIFSACGGACILRRTALEHVGLLDEAHFAYLEDVDLCWRGRLQGYRCYFIPAARVLHAGSASSGSKHNAFKVRLTARNSVWIIRKNMPVWQRILNLPFLMAGYAIKMVYFTRKGFGRAYAAGLAEGLAPAAPFGSRKDRDRPDDRLACLRIQRELWGNTLRRFGENV